LNHLRAIRRAIDRAIEWEKEVIDKRLKE
jgi:hypothetical protein